MINHLKKGIKLANTLRQAASVEELYYSPSLRETIAYAKLIDGDMSPKESSRNSFWKSLCTMGKY